MNICINCGKEASHQHHVIPRALNGNNGSNLVWLCDECHGLIHKINFNNGQLSHSELVKNGIEKAKHNPCEKLISLYDFYYKLEEALENKDYIDINTVLDIINECPIKGYHKINN